STAPVHWVMKNGHGVLLKSSNATTCSSLRLLCFSTPSQEKGGSPAAWKLPVIRLTSTPRPSSRPLLEQESRYPFTHAQPSTSGEDVATSCHCHWRSGGDWRSHCATAAG